MTSISAKQTRRRSQQNLADMSDDKMSDYVIVDGSTDIAYEGGSYEMTVKFTKVIAVTSLMPVECHLQYHAAYAWSRNKSALFPLSSSTWLHVSSL